MKNGFNARRARPWFRAAKCEQCGRELTVFERGLRWERAGGVAAWLCSDHTPRDPEKALAKVARIERKRARAVIVPPKAGTAAIPPAPSVVIVRNEIGEPAGEVRPPTPAAHGPQASER